MRLRVPTNRYFSAINEFCFIKEIGVGSFGTVKLALHIQTNKCYAVKVVNLSRSRSTLAPTSGKTKCCCCSERSICIQVWTIRTSSNYGTLSSREKPSIWLWNLPKTVLCSLTKTSIKQSTSLKPSSSSAKPSRRSSICTPTTSCTEISR